MRHSTDEFVGARSLKSVIIEEENGFRPFFSSIIILLSGSTGVLRKWAKPRLRGSTGVLRAKPIFFP